MSMKLPMFAAATALFLTLPSTEAHAVSSSGNFNDITPVCIGAALTYPAETSANSAHTTNPEHDYGTVSTSPNPGWFYFKADTSGTLEIVQTNSNNVDVDGVLWGPFSSVADLTRDGLTTANSYQNLLDSDYLAAAGFNFTQTVTAGQYYVLLVANFSGSPTEISLDTGGATAATTDCSLPFDLKLTVDDAVATTTEGGATYSYTVELHQQPTATVTVNLANTTGEVTLSTSSLTFTVTDWDSPQTVTLTANNDVLLDGNLTDTITHTATSTDANYDGKTAEVAAIAIDNEVFNAPTVTALTTNNTTPTITGTHKSEGLLSVTVDGTTYTEGGASGALTDNGNDTWTLTIPGGDALGQSTYDVVATATLPGRTTTDGTTGELTVDTTAPVPTITVNSVTVDNTVNAAESAASINITGTVGGEFITNDTVQLTIDGNNFSGQVNAAGAFSIAVPGSVLAGTTSIAASVATTDTAGNPGSASTTANYSVDTTAPVVTLTVNDVTADNVLNAAEASGTVALAGAVSGEFNTGDTVTLTVNGNTYTGSVNGSGAYSINVPGSDLANDTSVAASVTTTDAAGNSSTVAGNKPYSVDTTPPVANIAINDITADNILNTTEAAASVAVSGAVAGDFANGDIVTLTVNGSNYTGPVNAAGVFSISVPGSELENDSTVGASVTVTDTANNATTASNTQAYSVDTTAPAVTLAVNNITTDNILNAVEAGAPVAVTGTASGDFIAGDTVTLTVDGNTFTGNVNGAGAYSINVPGSDLANDTNVVASLTTTDTAGNATTAGSTQSYTVDTTAPAATLSVNDVTADNVLNAVEAGAPVAITGTVAGEFTVGDTVTLTVNGSTFTGTVNGAGAYSINVPGSDLANDTNVVASVTATDTAGNATTVGSTKGYTVDVTAPAIALAVDDVTADNILNAAEAAAPVAVTGSVTGDYIAGDTVTLTVNGGTFTGNVNAAGAYSINVPGSDLANDTNVVASLTTTDTAGNATTAGNTKTYSVDTAVPVIALVVDDVTADNILNATEATAPVAVTGSVTGDFTAGDTVTLTVDGNTFTGNVNAAGAYSINVPGSDLANDTNVVASLTTTDTAGNATTAGSTQSYTIDTTAPAATLSVNDVTADNVLNAVEAGAPVAITGTVAGEFTVGDTVTLTVNSSTFTGTVNGAGAYSINVPGSDLANDTNVVASVTATDTAGNATTVGSTKGYTVDVTAPAIALAVDDVTADNILNAAEAAAPVAVTGSVTGDYIAGDTVTLTVNGGTFTGNVNAAGAYSINVPGSDLANDTNVVASLTTTDTAGNATTAGNTKTYSVDTAVPVIALVVDDVTADNILNATEATAPVAVTGSVTGDFTAGDTVTLTVNGGTFTGNVNAAGAYSINVPGSDLANDTNVVASLTTTDTAGNATTAGNTKTYSVDTAVPVIALVVDDVTADNMLNATEAAAPVAVTGSVTGDFTAGDTVTLTVDGNTFTGNVNAAGAYSINVPGSDLANDTNVVASVTATDTAGNATTVGSTKGYTVDVTAPAIALVVDDVTADNILNAAEAAAPVAVTGSVTGDFTAGDTVTLTVNGNTFTGAVNAAGAYSINIPGSELESDTTVDATLNTTDDAGNTGTASSSHAYTVDTTVPATTLAFDAIASDDIVNNDESGGPIAISGTVTGDFTAGDTVTLTVNGNTYTGTVDAAGVFSIDVPGSDIAADTSISASVTSTDTAGNSTTSTADSSYTVDTAVPALSAANPPAGNDATPTLSGTTDEPAGSTVTVVDAANSPVCSAVVVTGSPDNTWSCAPATHLPEGDNALVASITDAAGNLASVSLTASVDTSAPTLTVDNQAQTDDSTPQLTGRTDEAPGSIVNLTDANGNPVCSATVSSDGNWSCDVSSPLDEQMHVFTASITDAAGNAATADMDVTVDFDYDNDGISNAIEGTVDSDNDGIEDYLDTDSDNDGTPDILETEVDTDNDGIPDYIDTDSDGDGLSDSGENTTSPAPTGTDSDNDGIDDALDVDSTGGADTNGDGIDDALAPTDSDGDSIPDHLDADSDNDGLGDAVEGIVDAEGDGVPAYLDSDSDGDGISDSNEGAVDSDADGTPDFLDLDSDGDGIADATEAGSNPNAPVDSDADGIPDVLDTDSDGDGINDSVESGSGSQPQDTDNDGTPDYLDSDSDGDGVADSTEGAIDSDGDGISDLIDPDSDNDGIDDELTGTGDTDGDGIPNTLDGDIDGDGISNAAEGAADNDGDGILNFLDNDSDNDGIADVDEGNGDLDGDGLPNFLDTDSDGDGTSDSTEAGNNNASPVDTDADGQPDFLDADSDGDGISDAQEGSVDTDADGIIDSLDTDSDGDRIPDAVEGQLDYDGDGAADYVDLDSDNDSIVDSVEAGADPTQPVDTDGDGQEDFRDVDSDGDGINDSMEGIADSDGDGIADAMDTDSNNDGIPDNLLGAGDADGDGIPDFIDDDIDGDGIANISEQVDGQYLDTDSDGTPDYADTDADGDGIADQVEGVQDADGDGVPNFIDTDADGDGIDDQTEAGNNAGAPIDSDADGTPDFLDTDADGDSVPDSVEGNVDSDGDGTADYIDTDSDNDGTDDRNEGTIDTDGDGLSNAVDPDSDNDGISDIDEGTGDYDADGIIDALDTDSDNDGIPDASETNGDNDGDGIPDYKDRDSDNDGLTDTQEAGGEDVDGDGIIDSFVDANNDGVNDATDAVPLLVTDFDNDGVADYRDVDSDNDGLTDLAESAGFDSDADADGRVDGFVDANGDGIDDGVAALPIVIEDTDQDGQPDHLDLDTDNDGVNDITEAGGTDSNGDGIVDELTDVDEDGIPDSVDVDVTMGSDADGDGIDDSADVDFVDETDTDFDGIIDSRDPDDDGNGFVSILASDDGSSPGMAAALPDADNNGIPDVEEANLRGEIHTGLDGSGCSIVPGNGKQNPLFLMLMLLAAFKLLKRSRRAAPMAVVAIVGLGTMVDAATHKAIAADDIRQPTRQVQVLYPVPRLGAVGGDSLNRGFYAGFGLGMSKLNPDTSQVTGIDVTDSAQNSFQLTLGLDINKWMSAELHAAELGDAGLSTGDGINYQTFGASGLFYVGKNRHRFKRHGLSAFGRLGFGVLSNSQIGGQVDVVQDNSSHILYGLGLEYTGRRGFGVRAEGIFVDTDVSYTQLGLLYRFGKPRNSKPTLIVEQGRAIMPVYAPFTPPVLIAATAPKPVVNAEPIEEPAIAAAVPEDIFGILDDVTFESGSDVLTPDARVRLNDVLGVLQRFPEVNFIIAAHTDSEGPEALNQALSAKRAKSVARFLVAGGISTLRFRAMAYGESQPVTTNETAAGRAQNRRVELLPATSK